MIISLFQKTLKTFKLKNLNAIILVSFSKDNSFEDIRYRTLNNTNTNLATGIPLHYQFGFHDKLEIQVQKTV